jgi:hypothetical protein
MSLFQILFLESLNLFIVIERCLTFSLKRLRRVASLVGEYSYHNKGLLTDLGFVKWIRSHTFDIYFTLSRDLCECC